MKAENLLPEEYEPPSPCRYAAGSVKLRGVEKGRTKKISSAWRFPENPRSRVFREKFFHGTGRHEWNDWRWQIQHRFRTIASLRPVLNLTDAEADTALEGTQLPLAVTPYYASLLDPDDPTQPLRRAVVPVCAENHFSPGEADDPLGEEHDSPVKGIVHRYPDRVLFIVTDFCSTYCRYCTRSRMVGHREGAESPFSHWGAALDYIERNRGIRDVLISGGDPLTLSDEKLQWLLNRLHRIKHVEFLRIGTKVPAVLPQRITPELVRMLKRFHPLWMSIHFMHPAELTAETACACERLADAGIPLGSQTVLLAGINDQVQTMQGLVHGLLRLRVRPYYLYQCDPIQGSAHFRTPVEKGLEIIAGLRGHTTGYAVPTYVIDAPGGGGKIPLLPESVLGMEDGNLLLVNYQGRVFQYPNAGQGAGLGCAGRIAK